MVVLSQDWHPKGHRSFSSSWAGQKDTSGKVIEGGSIHVIDLRGTEEVLWPDHCIQHSSGAQFHSDLHIAATDVVIKKGTDPEVDSYSAFADNHHSSITELYRVLDSHNITDVYVCGIATDYCVNYTCQDARVRKDDPKKKPFNTYLIVDATLGVSKDTSEKAVKLLQEAPFNVHVTSTDEILQKNA